jgi:hypothetical protein
LSEAGDTPPGDALAEAKARHRRALEEVARLNRVDDHGSGERTARLAMLGSWEVEVESARLEVERLTGKPWPEEAASR